MSFDVYIEFYFLDLGLSTRKQDTYEVIFQCIFQTSNSAGRYQYPWHNMVNEMREFMTKDLFITHPVMYTMLFDFETRYVCTEG
jgi:hypothetical protein